MGRLWKTDIHGNLLNDASPERIGPPYDTLLEQVVESYTKHAEQTLHSIYVTGLVARGLAVPGKSDVEVFAIYEPRIDPEELDETWLDDEEDALWDFYRGLVTDLQLETWAYAYVFEEPERFSAGAFTIKTQSVCIWGSDLAPQLPDYNLNKPGVRLAIANDDIAHLREDLHEAETEIQRDPTPENIRFWCRRACRALVHTGFSLATYDMGVYTRDFDLCVEYFKNSYSAQADAIRQAWDYVQSPTPHADDIRRLLDNFGGWMLGEADRWLDQYNPARHAEFQFDDEDLLE